MARIDPNPLYRKAIKAGLIKYLHKMPWAMTAHEIARAEGNGFLKQFYIDCKSECPQLAHKTILNVIGNNLLHITRDAKQLKRESIASLGRRYFKISLGKGRTQSSSKAPTLIVLKKESEEKFAVRILLEYWDFVLNRDIENAPVWFKFIYHLGENGAMAAKDFKKVLDVSYHPSDIMYRRYLLKKHAERPPLVQKVKRGVYALSEFFKPIWTTAMDKHVLERWDDWKEVRALNRFNWIRSH